MSVEDCCAVCAEPLVWCGFGECGHTETCSKCVARWRFVLKDNSCMMCKQDQPAIFFTRFMGDFTPRLSSEQFSDLEARANRGELYHLLDIKGYFDDQAHFQLIKSLCGYTHPVISERCAAAGRETPIFTSVNGMKKFVDMHYKMNFCDICLTSRKVFMCEQLLYNKADLDKHMKTGDETGPLAETSFKGHPICKFCRKRFYDSNDLFKHMESEHEQCFLCRRQNPSQYVYYRHYEELEEHFNSAHHPCPHPSCLEKKFVVFLAEHELKRHFASEHGDELKMSRAQRREALTIPVNLQYRDPAAEAAALAHALPGVTIGGGDQVVSRHGRNTASAQRARAVESAGQGSSSGYGGSNGYDDTPSSVAFTTEDFPQAQGMANGMSQMVGRWAGYSTGAEGSSSNNNNNGAGPSRGLSQEAFPSLPTMSKAAKKKLRAQQQSAGTSLADQLRAVNMPVRVISRASNTPPRQPSNQPDPPARAAGSSAAASSRPASAAAPAAAAAPASSAAGTSCSSILATNPAAAAVAAALMPTRGLPAPTPAMPDRPAPPALPEPTQSALQTAESGSSVSDYPPEPAAPVFRAAHLTVAAIAAGRGATDSPARPASSRPPAPPSADDFPSLPAAPPPAARGAAPAAGVQRFSAAAGSRPVAGTSSFPPPAASSSGPSQPTPQLQGADFPSLPPTTAAGRRPVSATTKMLKPKLNPTASSSMQRPSSWGQQLSQAGSSAPPVPTPAPAPASPARSASPALPGSSVSKGLQEANRQLIAKIQSQLADESRFATFKSQSQAFLRGDLGAPQYHEHVIQLGLMALVPELAALCPAADRRDALLAAHVAFVSTPAAQKPAAVSGGWVPPEVAIAAAEQAAQRASWSCPDCTLTNAPEGVACEACGTMRPGYTPPPTDAFPSLTSTYSSGRSSAAASSTTTAQAGSSNAPLEDALADGMGGKGKKKGGTKITIGLGAGTGPSRSSAGPSNQAALRSQVEQARNIIANRGAGKSAWAAAGGGTKLARLHGAINDAWGDN